MSVSQQHDKKDQGKWDTQKLSGMISLPASLIKLLSQPGNSYVDGFFLSLSIWVYENMQILGWIEKLFSDSVSARTKTGHSSQVQDICLTPPAVTSPLKEKKG